MKNGYDKFFKQAQKSAMAELAQTKSSRGSARAPMKSNRKKKSAFPVKLIVLSGMGFSLALGGFIYVDQIESFLKRVNINFMGQAFAEEAAAKPETEKPAASTENKGEASGGDAKKAIETAEQPEVNLDHLQKLVERQKELEAKEEELKKIEEELAVQKQELEKKLKELDGVRGEISTVLNDRVQADSQKVDNLVQLYTNMRPQQASKVFETLDEDLTVEVLGRMKKKNAAEIMNLMKPDKAKVLSERLAGYKRSPALASNTTSPKSNAPEAEPNDEQAGAPESSPNEGKKNP